MAVVFVECTLEIVRVRAPAIVVIRIGIALCIELSHAVLFPCDELCTVPYLEWPVRENSVYYLAEEPLFRCIHMINICDIEALVDEIEIVSPLLLALNVLHAFLDSRYREDVDEYALADIKIDMLMMKECRVLVSYFGENIGTLRLISPVLDLKVVREHSGRFLDEPVVVLPRHSNIDVIVPRDKAFMPYGADKSAEANKILYSELLAGVMDLLKDIYLFKL